MIAYSTLGADSYIGVVLPLRWDELEEVREVSLLVFGDREYRVEPENLNASLIPLIGRVVEVSGNIRGGFGDAPSICIDDIVPFETGITYH